MNLMSKSNACAKLCDLWQKGSQTMKHPFFIIKQLSARDSNKLRN